MGNEVGAAYLAAQQAAAEKKRIEEENRKNNINGFIWKGAKKANGEQDEIRLVDATEQQLNKFYNHCFSMLYSNDKNNPGRKVLLNIIKEQRTRCNVELFMRWLENTYKPTEREEHERYTFLSSMNDFIDANPEVFPTDQLNNILITSVAKGIPNEFKDLTIASIKPGCLRTLGIFNKKHITLTFITKQGLWFTKEEKKEFNDESKKTGKNRIDIVKEKCGLKPTTNIKISSDGLFNFKEFKAMVDLKNKEYYNLDVEQLEVLRNKLLFALEDEVKYHIKQWEERIEMLEKVAKFKGYTLKVNE